MADPGNTGSAVTYRRRLSPFVDAGGVDETWFNERRALLTEQVQDDADDHLLHVTSSFTLMGPIRGALLREVRRRAAELGATT